MPSVTVTHTMKTFLRLLKQLEQWKKTQPYVFRKRDMARMKEKYNLLSHLNFLRIQLRGTFFFFKYIIKSTKSHGIMNKGITTNGHVGFPPYEISYLN